MNSKIFDKYKDEYDLDKWDDFPELMCKLGFEMDCGESFENYVKSCGIDVKEPKNEREKRKNNLLNSNEFKKYYYVKGISVNCDATYFAQNEHPEATIDSGWAGWCNPFFTWDRGYASDVLLARDKTISPRYVMSRISL